MRTFSPRRPRLDDPVTSSGLSAFSLVELLVTLVILLLVLATLFQFTEYAEQDWKTASADPFADAEEAFESVVDHVATATLESYQDYADTTGAFRSAGTTAFTPDHLARRSDLAFVCGPSSGTNGWLNGSGRTTAGDSLFFLAPQGYTQTEAHLGLARLLDALGYFLEFSDENRPSFMLPGPHRWRWRLEEVAQPSELLGIYHSSSSQSWVQSLVPAGAPVSILAENIVAFVALPDAPANQAGTLPPSYSYDSRDASNPLTRHQLPARLRLALVAIDEASAQILAAENGAQPPALVPSNLFLDGSKMDADLAVLDATLTTNRIRHRIFQREILLPAAAWSGTPSS